HLDHDPRDSLPELAGPYLLDRFDPGGPARPDGRVRGTRDVDDEAGRRIDEPGLVLSRPAGLDRDGSTIRRPIDADVRELDRRIGCLARADPGHRERQCHDKTGYPRASHQVGPPPHTFTGSLADAASGLRRPASPGPGRRT